VAIVVLACGGAAAWLWTSGTDAGRTQEAYDALVSGRAAEAERLARDVEREPAAARAAYTRAVALRELGRYDEANRVFADVAAREPNSWQIHREWAISLAREGQLVRARRELARAVELNPRVAIPVEFTRR
jgi:Flp pilus assembly protein TadD